MAIEKEAGPSQHLLKAVERLKLNWVSKNSRCRKYEGE
jgi:hypothetical protein